MKYVVKVEILHNACGDGAVHRRIVKREMERILSSSLIAEGEAYPDGGGGIFIAEARRPGELYDLIGSQVTGLCRVDTNPILRCMTIAPADAEPTRA